MLYLLIYKKILCFIIKKMNVLVFGGKGWIASYVIPIMKNMGWEVTISSLRAEETSKIMKLIEFINPDRVICFIGRTYGPGYNSIDYLEQPGKLQENIRDNLYGPVAIGLICLEKHIHYTYIGTGCIYGSDDTMTKKYLEYDDPNFYGSAYSTVKGFTDRIMKLIERNTLNVRIRFPITADLHKRNFITKIIGYDNICSVSNSMSVLPTLIPYLLDMIEKAHKGTINLVNPGIISHNEILELYKKKIDPDKKWDNISISEQDNILASKRSNNQLDTTLLQTLYPKVPNIHDAVEYCIDQISKLSV